jgi:hypothetical protein
MKKTAIILALIALTLTMSTSCTHSHETKTVSATDSTELVIDSVESSLDSLSLEVSESVDSIQ